MTMKGIVLLLVIFVHAGNARIVVRPLDVEVLVTHSTYFNCSTFNLNSEEVIWYHYRVDIAERRDVYDDEVIDDQYKGRFEIQKHLSTGVFNLIVLRTELTDAGRYECWDGRGHGSNATAQLVVLDSLPVCQSNATDKILGQNSCSLQPDDILLSCLVTYRGKVPPKIQWMKTGDKDNRTSQCGDMCNNSTQEDNTNNVTYTTMLKSNTELDGYSFFCQTVNSRTEQYRCASQPIRVMQFSANVSIVQATTGEEITCPKNSDESCTYRWYNQNQTEVSSIPTFRPNTPGRYTCQALCNVGRRNEMCIFDTMVADVSATDSGSKKLLALLVILVVVIGLPLVLFLCWKCSCRRQPSKLLEGNQAGPQDSEMAHLQPSTDGVTNSTNTEYAKLFSPSTDGVTSSMSDDYTDLFSPSTAGVTSSMSDDNAETVSSLAYLPNITPKAVETNSFDQFTKQEYYIDKGSSGEAYGPFAWRNKKCALKRYMFGLDKLTDEKKDDIKQLGERWKRLHHNNVAKVFEVIFCSPAVYLIMEYADGSSLDKVLHAENSKHIEPNLVINWALQIAKGMNYLHENKIVHRNLKPAKVLLMKPNTNRPNILKIGGYMQTKEHDHSTVLSFKGTVARMAPECIQEKPFSERSDVWSYGVMVWEILTRQKPHDAKKNNQIIRDACNGTLTLEIRQSFPPIFKMLLQECWKYETHERPSFSHIVSILENPQRETEATMEERKGKN